MITLLKITQVLRICLGCIFLLFGFLGVGFGIIEIIDPVGSKMSDDNDPLGVPRSFIESLFITCVYALVFIMGIWLVLGFKTKRKL